MGGFPFLLFLEKFPYQVKFYTKLLYFYISNYNSFNVRISTMPKIVCILVG